MLVSILGTESSGATKPPLAKMPSRNSVKKLSRMPPKLLLLWNSMKMDSKNSSLEEIIRQSKDSSKEKMMPKSMPELRDSLSELGTESSTATLLQNAKLPSRNTDSMLLRLLSLLPLLQLALSKTCAMDLTATRCTSNNNNS